MFRADYHEAQEILRLLEPAHDDIDFCALNEQGWADYYWTGIECYCHGSHEYNTERKTVSDLVGPGIEDVEEQLYNQLRVHPGVHHRLLIEGVIEPAMNGILVYYKRPGSNVLAGGLKGLKGFEYKKITNWLKETGKYFEIIQTSTMAATASTLSAYYQADQVEEEDHSTFRRMFKTLDYRINPQAQRILGASGDVKIGSVKAEALATYFGTAIRAFQASPQEWAKVPGIGKVLAEQYLRGIGRGDV